MISVSGGFSTKLNAQHSHPKLRLLFYEDILTDTSIAFHENSPSNDTITDSNNGFVAAGFQAGDEIMVTGSANSNNGYFTALSVAAGTITLVSGDDIQDESAGASITIQVARPGDYDSYVIAVSEIRRDARLSTGSLTIRLANTDGQWNNFISTLTDIGKPVRVQLYWDGDTEYLNLFAGKIEDVDYVGAECILKVKDKFADLMEVEVGSGQSPVQTYAGLTISPGDLAWALLTDDTINDQALDDTADATNIDIDYAAWSAWDSYCDGRSFELRARITGQTIRHLLSEIAYLTDSYISVNADGKLDFHPTFNTATGQAFTVSNCLEIDLDIDMRDICNKFQCFYNYNAYSDFWPASYTDTDSTSQTNYGKRSVVEEGKVIWHADQTSADNMTEDKMTNWKNPIKYGKITTNAKGLLTEIGDEVTVTESLKGLSSGTLRIEAIESIRIPELTVSMIGRIV